MSRKERSKETIVLGTIWGSETHAVVGMEDKTQKGLSQCYPASTSSTVFVYPSWLPLGHSKEVSLPQIYPKLRS